MSRDSQRKQQVLECLLQTKEQPKDIRRSERVVSCLCFLAMFALLVGPIFYFRDLGLEKYVISISAASAGMLAMFWQSYSQHIQAMKDLHDFVDFEKLKSALKDH